MSGKGISQFLLKMFGVLLLAGSVYSLGFYTGYTKGKEDYHQQIMDSHQFLFEKQVPADTIRKS